VIRFVTGTDTGVGKTVASAAMALGEQAAGRRAVYFKPVQTGVGPGEPGDADFVAAVGIPAAEGVRLNEPLAPAVAAERAGTVIDVDGLVARAVAEAAGVDVLVVEGAGGLLVPLAGEQTMADLAGLLAADVVIVTRPGLGTLNHTALTLEAARTRRLPVAGLVVCGWPAEPGVTERTNLERLAAMAPVLGVVPFLPGLDTAHPGPLPDLAFKPAPNAGFARRNRPHRRPGVQNPHIARDLHA
jgi:dethiobiotin synthetase